jgi:hypothetical protein
MLRSTLTAAALAAVAAAPLAAQDTGDHSVADHGAMATTEGVPDGWLMRFDRSSATADMVDFQVMPPGWHITTGRAGSGIFWKPDMTATGSFTASTTIHLFSPASHAEAFGIFLGGQNLGEENQEYLYFLVRQTGQYLVKRRTGNETENVVGWTAHEAIPETPAGAEQSTEYALSVQVGEEEVAFLVNGTVVHTLPRSELHTDGVVGVRINHMLNVHVEEVTVES